jgi:thiopurine S-methyltransferase
VLRESDVGVVRYGLAAMDVDWIARWRDGRIGFHEGRPNALLERHIARIASRRRVLVPLCGRSEDLAFLAAHGHDVLGIELAEQAVREFFDAHALVPQITTRGPFVAYTAGSITLLAGDFFAATPELIGLNGPIDAFYDRAALIALPSDLRPRYVAKLRALVPAGAAGLVITLEYDPQRMTGPPFPVFESELRALHAGSAIELLEDRPAQDRATGTQPSVSATERCFAIWSNGG